MAREITVEELKHKLDAGDEFVFVDVREPHEYEEFNLGAKLIPLGEVPQRIGEFGPPDGEIVVHCRSGARSGRAQQYLEVNGYTNVANVTGGALAWRERYGS